MRSAMPRTAPLPNPSLVASPALGSANAQQGQQAPQEPTSRGFGAGESRAARRRGGRRRAPALSKADWGPLGKHPDLEAIVARQRLQLPLSGRLTAAQVNLAWKRCAADHHPDRGGDHDTMQLVNGARDRLLGR